MSGRSAPPILRFEAAFLGHIVENLAVTACTLELKHCKDIGQIVPLES